MLEVMEDLMEHADSPLNKKVEGDWKAMPFPDHEFDLILSEQSLNMVCKDGKEQVLKECVRVLKDMGRALIKIQHLTPEFRLTIKKATDRFVAGEIAFNDFYMYILHSADGNCYNPDTETLPLKCDIPIIGGLVEKGVLKEEVQVRHKIECAAHYSEHKLYLLEDKETEALVKKYFEVERVIRGTEFEMRRILPIYICRKK